MAAKFFCTSNASSMYSPFSSRSTPFHAWMRGSLQSTLVLRDTLSVGDARMSSLLSGLGESHWS
jgi:hypothetical protein